MQRYFKLFRKHSRREKARRARRRRGLVDDRCEDFGQPSAFWYELSHRPESCQRVRSIFFRNRSRNTTEVHLRLPGNLTFPRYPRQTLLTFPKQQPPYHKYITGSSIVLHFCRCSYAKPVKSCIVQTNLSLTEQ